MKHKNGYLDNNIPNKIEQVMQIINFFFNIKAKRIIKIIDRK